MNKGKPRKRGMRTDWVVVPYLLLVITGFIVSIYDFMIIQQLQFQIAIPEITGIILLIIGGVLRIVSRKTLMKAGFTLVNSAQLQIVEGQSLITDGVYAYIRHPLYLGEIVRNLGFALILTSLVGFILMLVGNAFLLLRIRVEETMLIEAFGHEYVEYRERTKQLIPYIF